MKPDKMSRGFESCHWVKQPGINFQLHEGKQTLGATATATDDTSRAQTLPGMANAIHDVLCQASGTVT